jgi:23S rRNA (cytidine1920-2'-O)/16S rRNA (cytidine1409-2'-O)-methyltransferase
MERGGRPAAGRERLDVLLARRGLAETREKAQRLILAGEVRVDGTVSTKPGHAFAEDAAIEVARPPRFVSRGGQKLDAALDSFGVQVRGLTCLDVGSSTGGFTDCLLQRGAAGVIAVDVGTGLLHWKLRRDRRVTVREGLNARYLRPEDLPAVPEFAAVDVSFISLTKILPAVISVLRPGAEMVTLVKPQFEAGRGRVGRGGVVRDPAVRADVMEEVKAFGTGRLGLTWVQSRESPVTGPAGNVEFLVHWRCGPLDAARSTEKTP